MHIIKRSETRSVSITSPPDVVHAYLAEAKNLPEWAPAFAPSIHRSGRSWLVTGDDRRFMIDILVEPTARTVDIVSAENHARGLFTRVLPNADGSELLFTLFFGPDTPEDAIQTQILTLDAELAAVRDACQQKPPRDATA